MRTILLVIASILGLLYVYSYYQIPSSLTILQASLEQFQFDMLREKQPIVIHDRLPNLDTIRSYWFSVNKVRSMQYKSDESGVWQRNRYKYLVLHPQKECEIMVALGNAPLAEDGTPDPESSLPVVFKMQANQMVILPYRCYWMMATPCDSVHALGVHDWVTYFLP